MRKAAFLGVLAFLVAAGALVSLSQTDQKTDLSAALEMWGDVLRDADEVTLQATRVSDGKEMLFGRQMRRRLPPDDPAWTPYVDAVGQSLTAGVRRPAIRYQFHVIDGPELNAFAIPGGQIFIYTGLLQFLKSEAELAAILGHEISHVDLRHCIARYQYELAARKLGLNDIGQIADIARLPITIGYQKNQELEADAQGLRLSTQAGYDPGAASALFLRMHVAVGEPAPARASTPEAELAGTLAGGFGDYFRSHPSSQDRAQRLHAQAAAAQAHLKGKKVYVGVMNFQGKVAKSQHMFAAEEETL